MCGINGVFNHQPYYDVEIKVKSMNDLTHHRGPDFSAIYPLTKSSDLLTFG